MSIDINSNIKKSLQMALSFCQEGKFNEAREIYIKLQKKIPSHPELLTNLGTIELQSGNTLYGIELLKKSLKIDPQQLNALINLGNGLLELNKNQEAILKYNDAIKLRPSYFEAYYNKARALKGLGNVEEAILNYSNSIELNSNFILSYINRAELLSEQKKYTEAIEDYSEAIRIDPSSEFLYWKRGLVYNEIKDKDLALDDFNCALNLNPNFFEGLLERGSLFHQLNNLNEALSDFSKAIILEKNDPDIYFRRSLVYKDLGDEKKAEADCDQAIILNPSFLEAHNDKGKYLLDKGKYTEALEEFEVAVKIDGNNLEAYTNRAAALNELQKYHEAIQDCNKVIKINPLFKEAYINRAAALCELQKYDDAVQDCNMALKIDPEFATIYVNRGKIYSDKGDKNMALQDFNKAISLNSKLSDAYFNAAFIYLSQKNFDKGWTYYEKRNESVKIRSNFLKNNKKPPLDNLNTKNKRVLIFAEQGLGDQIIFLSVLRDINLKENLYTVMLDERLINIYRRSFNQINFLSKKVPLDEVDYDFYIMAGSLPAIYRQSIKDFENNKSQYLFADINKTELLRKTISQTKKICGISWKSKNNQIGKNKSLELSNFKKILKIPIIEFVNLQYGDVLEEIKNLEKNTEINIRNVSEIDNTNDIDGLLSLINACDFIITTSNVTAHLAGSIGKKTYLILPKSAGRLWYWHQGDKRSIWYPSVMQFEQENSDSYNEVINKIYELIIHDISTQKFNKLE